MNTAATETGITGPVKLLVALGLVALVWLVALPWAANRPAMETHLDWLDEQGVDPSAMYYTELEMMKPIFTRLALEQREPGDASGSKQ